jgi:S-adenosylmethionine/arginine decarboxylase-like enzyme
MNHFTCREGSHVRSKVARITYKLYDCDAQRLSSPAIVWRLLREVTGESWKTRFDDSVSGLPGGGISGFVQLPGMHITIHAWPVKRYAELSVALSNSQSVPERLALFFADRLGAAWVQSTDAPRTSSAAMDELVLLA